MTCYTVFVSGMKGGFVPCSYYGTLHLRANGIFAFGAHLTVDLRSLLDREGLSFSPGLPEEFLGKTGIIIALFL